MKFNLNIDDVSYEIPETFTVSEWMKIVQWKVTDIEEWSLIINAATGAPLNRLMEIQKEDPDTITFAISILFGNLQLKSKGLYTQINGYKLVNLEESSIGFFIDLDVLAVDNKIDRIISMMYDMPLDKVVNLDITLVYPAVESYLNWRRSVYQSYKDLFDYTEDVSQQVEGPQLSAAHAWYETIMALCDGKFENIEYAIRRPFREAFNYLAWKKTKQAEERMEIMKLQNKMKA